MNSQIPRTNEKLAFARLHLQQLEQAEQSSDVSQTLRVASFKESVIFHLMGAYAGFLRELAESYKVKDRAIEDLSSLKKALAELDRESSEVKELDALSTPGQWLYELKAAYQLCWQAGGAQKAKSETDTGGIQLFDIEQGIGHKKLSRWLDEFQTLVQRHRESMLEW